MQGDFIYEPLLLQSCFLLTHNNFLHKSATVSCLERHDVKTGRNSRKAYLKMSRAIACTAHNHLATNVCERPCLNSGDSIYCGYATAYKDLALGSLHVTNARCRSND